MLRAAGIRLASAQGCNANAVSEHAIALMLGILRRVPEARDNQAKRFWRGMMGDFAKREDEAGGKTVIVVGTGRIGGRIARICKALDMQVIGVRRDPSAGANGADEVHSFTNLPALLPRADFVVLACPLTDETRGLIGASAFAAMKPTAQLVNVARGRVVDEAALIAALQAEAPDMQAPLSATACIITVASEIPSPAPPNSSGIAMPSQPALATAL